MQLSENVQTGMTYAIPKLCHQTLNVYIFINLFIYLLTDESVLFGDWSHARGHQSDVLVYFQMPQQEQCLDHSRAHQRDWNELLSSHRSIANYVHVDRKEWLEGCAIPNLPGNIHQHQFKLVRDVDGKAQLFSRSGRPLPPGHPWRASFYYRRSCVETLNS